MTFDLEKAREICKGLPVGGGQTLRANLAFLSKYYPAGKMLPAALDEIERLQDREQQLLLDVGRNHNAKLALEKRIAELEADKKYWFEISGKQMQTVEQQHSTICKQRAALKNLAAKYRERGKALVEERAHAIECNPNRTREWTHAEAKERAREQLRQDGKI